MFKSNALHNDSGFTIIFLFSSHGEPVELFYTVVFVLTFIPVNKRFHLWLLNSVPKQFHVNSSTSVESLTKMHESSYRFYFQTQFSAYILF